MKTAVIFLLALTLALSSGCMCSYLTYQGVQNALKTPAPTAEPRLDDFGSASPEHPDVHFKDIQYHEPDMDALAQSIKDLQKDIGVAGDTEKILVRYEQIRNDYVSADSELSFLYVLYAQDVSKSAYHEQYAALLERSTQIDLDLTELSLALFESEAHGEAAKARYGEDYVAAVSANESLNSPEIQELLAREQDFIFEYDNLISGFQLSYEGRKWTLESAGEAYMAGEIDYETYSNIYSLYSEELNKEAGAIYLKLLALRAEIARTLGYGSYAAYCYDKYARDFTIDDAKELHAAVKKHIAPLYMEASEKNVEIYTLGEVTFSLDGFLAALQRVVGDFSPTVLEAYNFMLRNGLYDLDEKENKMAGNFTTYFSTPRTPFILGHWSGSSGDVRMVMHELGHFTRFYQGIATGWCETESLDLDEVDSQGQELLLSAYYDTFYGGNVPAATAELLLDGMYALISGCLEDEFQQAVYANPSMTRDEMNACYLQLAKEYGLADLYGYEGTEWAMVPHSFQSPMYYISYAVSMALAMEIWEESLTDFDAARDDYINILKRPAYSEFRETALANGFADPLSEEAIEGIANALRNELIGE